MNSTFVFGGGLICLIGLGATGFILLGEDKRKKAWAARREDTVGPYLKPKSAGGSAVVLAVRAKQRSTKTNPIHAIFNFKEERRQHYPMSLIGIMLCMLGPGAIGALLASKVLGHTGWFLLPVFDILLTRMFLGASADKVSRTLLSQFPDALAMVSRSVRVGVPVTEAVRIVGAAKPDRRRLDRNARNPGRYDP